MVDLVSDDDYQEPDVEDPVYDDDYQEPDLEADPADDDEFIIQVGRQSREAEPLVSTAPIKAAAARFGRSISRNYKNTDSHLYGAGDLSGFSKQLNDELLKSLDSPRRGWVKRLCDYTGMEMSWAAGPWSVSLESAYPYVLVDGIPRYHASPNVLLIKTCLNYAKRNLPIVTLPLLAEWIRAYDNETHIDALQPRLTWLFNALSNAHILAKIFKLGGPRENVFFDVRIWSTGKAEAVLDSLRTGSRTEQIGQVLTDWTDKQLFHIPFQRASRDEIDWEREYQTLRAIAMHYGLSPSEFDLYLTVPSASGSCRVFYPFLVFSRPQAIALGWRWRDIYSLCRNMLEEMQKKCNRFGVAAGLAEDADGLMVMYWMASHFSKLVQTIKAGHPEASQEEIAIRMLDRWNLPMVPWVAHPLKASLCKKQDHGIAMLFGFLPTKREDFDPIRHIDLARCTVTMDAWFTNGTMGDNHPTAWSDCRLAISQVPLHHPLFRVDPSMGSSMWRGSWDQTATLQAPSPQFEMQLVPLGPWISDDARSSQPFLPIACTLCAEEFLSIGRLVQHCRNEHVAPGAQPDDVPEAEHDSDEAAYWETHRWHGFRQKPEGDVYFACSVCNKSFLTEKRLKDHEKTHEKTHETGLLTCQKCAKPFPDGASLAEHEKTHAGVKPFACSECDKRFLKKHDLEEHERMHTGEKPIVCDICGRAFARKSSLRIHKKIHDNRPRAITSFACSICKATFPDQGSLRAHRKTHESEDSERFACSVCGKEFLQKNRRDVHERTHTAEKRFACSVCGKLFAKKTHKDEHERLHTGAKPHVCGTCNKGFATPSTLKNHEMTHTGEKPWQCKICGKGFPRKGNLERHMKVHE